MPYPVVGELLPYKLQLQPWSNTTGKDHKEHLMVTDRQGCQVCCCCCNKGSPMVGWANSPLNVYVLERRNHMYSCENKPTKINLKVAQFWGKKMADVVRLSSGLAFNSIGSQISGNRIGHPWSNALNVGITFDVRRMSSGTVLIRPLSLTSLKTANITSGGGWHKKTQEKQMIYLLIIQLVVNQNANYRRHKATVLNTTQSRVTNEITAR